MSFTVRPEFWSGKRVFITGHTGFMGAWLTLWLHDLGARVTGYSVASKQVNLFDIASLSQCCQTVTGDIRDFASLRTAIGQAQPDIVFHLAAHPQGPSAQAHPRETFETNVQGTVNLLEAARTVADPQAVIVASSDKVYENRDWCYAYRETDRLGGDCPFDASKAAAEMAIRAYQQQFGTHDFCVASARGGNVFGGGDWSNERLVPDAVRAFDANQILHVHNPAAVRSWQHVVEPLAGYLMLARAMCEQGSYFGQSWNFGPDSGSVAQVGKVADILAEAWGDGACWASEDAAIDTMTEPNWLHLDATRAMSELGWRPSNNLHGGLRATMRFYRACAFSATPEAIRQLMRSDRVGFAEANIWTGL